MTTDVQTSIRDLVQENRVHRAIYTDPAIFELEMKRIFSARGYSSAMRARSHTQGITRQTRLPDSPS